MGSIVLSLEMDHAINTGESRTVTSITMAVELGLLQRVSALYKELEKPLKSRFFEDKPSRIGTRPS